MRELFFRAVELHQSGNLAEAERLYRQILQAEPRNPNALHYLGVACHQRGDYAEAIKHITKSLKVHSNNSEALNHLALSYQVSGNFGKARSAFRKAISLSPENSELHFNIGMLFSSEGNLAEAVESYQKALSLSPGNVSILENLGISLEQAGHPEDAIAIYNGVLVNDPSNIRILVNLGNVYRSQGQNEAAIEIYQKVIALDEGNAVAHNNLGLVLGAKNYDDKAISHFETAISLNPIISEPHINLANSYRRLGRFGDALEQTKKAVSLNPENDKALATYANLLGETGDVLQSIETYHDLLNLNPSNPTYHSNYLLSEQYQPNVSAESLYELHKVWGERHQQPQIKLGPIDRDPDRALKVGLLSPDFGSHPIGYFTQGLLESPRDKISITCYSNRVPDDLTDRLQSAADQWRDIRGLHDTPVIQQITTDKIDILFELSGHSSHNHLPLFARRPAPIQISWAGYVGTTGVSTMDYVMADKHHVPEDEDAFYTETIIRMPDGYVSYAAPDYAPEVAELPFNKNSFITFGSFNNVVKINSEVLNLWAEIMRAVPNSQLFLKYRGIDDPVNRRRFETKIQAKGIAPERLRLEGSSPHKELLACYGEVDIALDTFPYSGGLTSCEALWMGVPVVTSYGNTFAGRHSSSHLRNVGLSEFVAKDANGYVDIAVQAALNTNALAILREALRPKMRASTLCDHSLFAANFEAAMRVTWQQFCL